MKTFETSQGGTPIPFKIDGEVFHARGEVSASVLLRFGELTTENPDEDEAAKRNRGALSIAALKDFFTAALTPEDLPRFMALLNHPTRFVTFARLVEIMEWLAEEYSNPTGEPSSSTSPPKRTGRGSTGGRSRTATTYSRPEPMPAGVSA